MKSKIRYIPCNSCGLGNKILGLISSIAYGISYSLSLKICGWKSLWWYFNFPLIYDNKNYNFKYTFKGHFYGIVDVINNNITLKYLLDNGALSYNDNNNIMVNQFAYKITLRFLQINNYIKSKLDSAVIDKYDIGIHLRTGKADGKEYLLHYLKVNDIKAIHYYIKKIYKYQKIYISTDSNNIKHYFFNRFSGIYYSNSSTCNSGFGLLKNNNTCAIEAITDYYILSKCKLLILTRCSSFSLISLFANINGFTSNNRHIFFGNCSLHFNLYK